jgi:opacity protein-like surface antigen
MKRFALAAVVAGILASPVAAADCAKDYKDFWDKINSQGSAKMSGEQYSKLSRMALRGFDACSAGDQKFDSSGFYEKLGQQANAIPNDFWEKLGQQGQSK